MKRSDLRQILDQHNLNPNKNYGQNFLCDQRALQHIASITPAGPLIEIGPGLGSLTQHIMHTPCRSMVLWEKDTRFEQLLRNLVQSTSHTVVMGDALDIPWSQYPGFSVVSNLPYNISVPFILHYLSHAQSCHLGSAVFMVQKEVADRLTAHPCTKSYGRLSVMAQTYADITKEFSVPPSAFWPVPKVHSCVIKITPRDPKIKISFDQLSDVVRQAFACRRKMLRHAFSHAPNMWSKLNIDPRRRAETLNLAEFWSLAHNFYRESIK